MAVWHAVVGVFLCAATAILVSCGGGDPIEEMLAHMRTVNDIIRNNMDNPDECIKQAKAYMDSHRAEIEQLNKEIQKIGDDDPEAATKIVGKMMNFAREGVKVAEEFQKKHPDKFGELLKATRGLKH